MDGQMVMTPILVSAQTPVNLLGRDILCQVMCSPDGLTIQPQDDVTDMYPALCRYPKHNPPHVYWLIINYHGGNLRCIWKTWMEWINQFRPNDNLAAKPWHVTLKFDTQPYDTIYQELLDPGMQVKIRNIYISPQGVTLTYPCSWTTCSKYHTHAPCFAEDTFS